MAIPAKVRQRLESGLKAMLPIINQQKARDVSEADTVTLVKDVLSDVFGYDKYADLTSEHHIRGTFCDLSIKVHNKIALLVEVKSAGSKLEERHTKQVVDYCANEGIEWAMLTNGSVWRLYEVLFAKPIDKRLVLEVDLSEADPRKDAVHQQLYPLTKEGFLKGAPTELRDRQDAISRFTIAALIVENHAVRKVLRRELRHVVDVLVDGDDIVKVLRDEVIKRDVLEGPQAAYAAKIVNKQAAKARHAKDKGIASEAAEKAEAAETA